MEMLSQDLFLMRDTCSVYVIRSGDQAVLVDFGDGAVLGERGEEIAGLHRDLLPLDMFDPGAEGFTARIRPYHWTGLCGSPVGYQVEVRNPLRHEADLNVRLVLPMHWQSQPAQHRLRLPGGGIGTVAFQVTPPPEARGRRFRLAVDLTAGDNHLGQQAEALVDLL